MKKRLIFFCTVFISRCLAQNLVPNFSFETTTGCGGNGALPQATGWNPPPGSITFADLYTPCGSNGITCSNFNTLNSMAGCSNACNGNNYTGQIGYYTGCPNCREYLQIPLSSALVAGTNYFLSFQTKLGPFCRYGCSRMGLLVSVGAPPQPASNQPILIVPQIESGLITDKINWTTVSGNYVAAGGENYVTVGIFYNNASLSIFDFGSSASGCALANAAAYYFADNIWVAPAAAGSPLACAPNSSNCAAPLPIELLNFNVKSIGNEVKLNWSTANEINNDYYSVENSKDGLEFFEINKINSKGNNLSKTDYETIDAKPFKGISYYRLKQTDVDGSFKYSETKAVNTLSFPGEIGIQPNPAEEFIDLVYSVSSDEIISVQIFDPLGKCVLSHQLNIDNKANLSRIDINHLSPGVYFIYISGEQHVQKVKFVKQ